MSFKFWGVTALVAAAALTLSACETMSAEECVAADWRALGYADAAGNGASRFAARSESCAKKGLSADGGAYQSGFAEGMYAFCQPQRGFQFARDGGSFSGMCPAELDRDFRAAYFDGQRVRQAQQALDEAHARVSRLQSEREDLEEDLRHHERALSEATTDEARRREQDEINHLRGERRELSDDIRDTQAQIPGLQYAYDRIRSDVGQRWGAW